MAWFLISTPLHAESGDNKKSSDGTVSILKFIPGIHQLKSKKYIKGTLFLGTFLGSVTGTFLYNSKGNQWYRKYKDSVNPQEIVLFRTHAEKSFRNRNLCIAGIFSIFLIHILDMKFFKTPKVGVRGTVSKNNIHLGFYYVF